MEKKSRNLILLYFFLHSNDNGTNARGTQKQRSGSNMDILTCKKMLSILQNGYLYKNTLKMHGYVSIVHVKLQCKLNVRTIIFSLYNTKRQKLILTVALTSQL